MGLGKFFKNAGRTIGDVGKFGVNAGFGQAYGLFTGKDLIEDDKFKTKAGRNFNKESRGVRQGLTKAQVAAAATVVGGAALGAGGTGATGATALGSASGAGGSAVGATGAASGAASSAAGATAGGESGLMNILSGAKGALGAYQLGKGLSQSDPERPLQQTPASVQEATNLARMQASASVRPGNDQAVQDINQQTANAIGAAADVSGSATDVLGAASRANVSGQAAIRQNNILNAQYKDGALRNYIGQLNSQGGYEQSNFETNQLRPYYEKSQAKGALIAGGVDNITGAGEDMVSYDILRNPKKYQGFLAG